MVRQLRLAIFVFLVHLSVAYGETVFYDSFDDGNAEDGMPVSWTPLKETWPGTYEASTGDYFLEPSVRAAVTGVTDLTLGDVSIRARARVLETSIPNGGIELLARADIANQKSYGGGIDEHGLVYLYASGKPEFDATETDLRPYEEDVLLQFDVFGNVLAAWAWRPGTARPSEPLVLAIDEEHTEGVIGIDYWAQEPNGTLGNAVFRFVHVSDTHIEDPSCDFTGEGFCDAADLDQMFALGEIAGGISVSSTEAEFDLNADGIINRGDLDLWLSLAASHNGYSSAYRRGDANLDGRVTSTDLNELALNWQITNATRWGQGDFNGDLHVDAADLNQLALNWKSDITAPAVAVPEPATVLMATYALAALGALRRRK